MNNLVNKSKVLKYLLFLVISFILYFANFNELTLPFIYPYILSGIYFNLNTVFVIFVYASFNILLNFSLKTIIETLLISLFLLFISSLHKFLKKPINSFLISLYFIVIEVILLYRDFNYINLLSASLGFIFLHSSINFLKAFFKRTSIVHFTPDQYICGSIFIAVLSIGLSNLEFFNFSFLKFFGIFAIMILTYVYSEPISFIFSLLMGIGYLFNNDYTYIFMFEFIALFCYGFKSYNKFFSCLSVVVAEMILAYYFNIYDYYSFLDFLPILLDIVLFLIFNKLLVKYIKNILGVNSGSFGIKTLVNRNREQICFKMNELSQVFSEMNRLYLGMIKGNLTNDDALKVLIDSLIKNLCGNCSKKEKCFSLENKEDTLENIKLVFKKGFEKGKINILDIPQLLSYRCNNISQFINLINNLIVNYRQYTQMIKNNDLSKMLVAEQLKGVSGLLDLLSMEIGSTVLFNNKLEEKLRDELAYYDILCEEVLVYDMNNETAISLVVNNLSINQIRNLENYISKIMKRKFLLSLNQVSTYGYVMEFKTAPKFGYIFGASGKGKETISGDTYSFTKINNDKVMFAICDGIGTGENAQNISSISLNLIENFYKAGYSSDIILSSVNKLLSTGSDENYSALDIVVLDLKLGLVNFIKLGAPDSLVRTSNGIELIRSGALPLGILEEVEPMILERILMANDMIVMCSDGIVDAFGSIEKLEEYVDYQTTTNPQVLADIILNQSMEYSLSLDDKTVICIRVFLNY